MNENILSKIKKNSVWAIIPARSGSKGVKNKNIKKVDGHPLMGYSIAAAKLSKMIDRVIVSTDSEVYAGIANRYGAETPFLRPAEISGDRSTDFEFLKHAIEWFYENEENIPELWVHLRCTTPFRKLSIIDSAVAQMISDRTADSLRSAHKEKYIPYKWFIDLGNGYYNTLMGNSFDDANNPRQDFPDIYVPDGYVDVLRTEYIIKHNLIHGERIIAFHSPSVVDLDYPEDLSAIKGQSTAFRSELNEYMERKEAVQ